MADFNWDALPDAPASAPASAPTPAPAQPVQNASFDWGSVPDATDEDLKQIKYGTIPEQAKTIAEGAARGATLGTSDLAENALFDNAKERQARMQANPWTSGLSQMAGGVGLITATGGIATPIEEAGLGEKATEFAKPFFDEAISQGQTVEEASKLARTMADINADPLRATLAKAAGFATEGAAFGAGNAITDYSLGDPNLNAQKILTDIGMGAALGGGLGALSKGAEIALPIAAQKLQSVLSAIKDYSTSAGENAPVDSWLAKFRSGLNGTNGSEQSIREMSSNLADVYNSSKEAASDLYETAAPANIGKALENMPLEKAQENGFKIYDQLENKISTLQADPDTFAAPQVKQIMMKMETLQNDLVDTKNSIDVHNAFDDFQKNISKSIKFDTMPTATQAAVQEELHGIRSIVKSFLKDPNSWGQEAATHYTQLDDQYSAYKNALKNFQSDFMKKEVSSNGSKNYVMNPSKVNTFFNGVGDVSQDLRSQHLEEFMNQAEALSKASENYHGYKAAEQTISDRVSQLAKKHEELAQVAKVMKNRLAPTSGSRGLGTIAEVGGAALSGHPAIASSIAAYKALKFVGTNPYALGSAFNKSVNTIKALGGISNSVGNAITSASKAIFTGSARGAVVGGAVSALGYDKRVNRIQELASSAQAMVDHLNKSTGAMFEAAPNISNSISNTMTTAVSFLNSKIPRPSTSFPLSDDYEPSAAQKDQFNRYYEAVDDPIGVLHSVKDGSISNEQIEALQVVYPHLLDEMRSNVMKNLSPNKDINYSTKIALAKFLGTPLDASMTPNALIANQIALNGPQQSAQGVQKAPKGKQKTTLGGLKELDVASRSATNTQSLEEDDA